MHTSKTTHERESDWQNIGELELSVGIGTDDAIHAWLTKILNSLNLSTEFLDRFLKSAQASVTRALGTNESVSLIYVHISILAPYKYNSERKSWGYFQIERIDMKVDNIDIQQHAIDFYLYVEGD